MFKTGGGEREKEGEVAANHNEQLELDEINLCWSWTRNFVFSFTHIELK